MYTKDPELTARAAGSAAAAAASPRARSTAPAAYWLEDDVHQRVTKLFRARDQAMRLAGRVLENTGSLDGWSVVFRDLDGSRRVIASGSELEVLAQPFMPERTPAEAEALRPFFEAVRESGFRHANEVTDRRVY